MVDIEPHTRYSGSISKGSGKTLTDLTRFFLEPRNATHRQYEALRAYFVESLPSQEVAQRFGYTPGSFRVLCYQFRHNPDRPFFLPPQKGPRPSPKKDDLTEQVVSLRKQNLSIYDISQALKASGRTLSPASVWLLLEAQGFARLPRRRDDERPPASRPTAAAVADVRELDLRPREFRTRFGGLFLFVPYLASIPLEAMLDRAGFPGSIQVPAAAAMRSLLALKLFDNARHSHVMSDVFDQGLALFAGLNAIPKRSFLTEYSCRIDPAVYPELMHLWFEAVGRLGLQRGTSFDLDFHTIPFHGEDALVQKHYVSKRSRRQKGILAFLARDAEKRVFCYANGRVRKEDRNDEILRFADFWEERTGHPPEEVVFDSQLTIYANLNQLNQRGMAFITLRRRSSNLLMAINQKPASDWQQIELKGVSRTYRTPRILEQSVELKGYQGQVRQLAVADLGHEQPTILLTNHMRLSPATLVERYAQRMLIENAIADGIEFFHMDALSSAVPMKVTCDLQLTLMASSLYRLLGAQVGNGYAEAKSQRIFRDFVDAVAHVTLTETEVTFPSPMRCCLLHRRGGEPLEMAPDHVGACAEAGVFCADNGGQSGRRRVEMRYNSEASMRFTVEIEEEEDGRWIAEVTQLPGVLAYGQTPEEARAKAQALALRVVADRLEHGEAETDLLTITFAAA